MEFQNDGSGWAPDWLTALAADPELARILAGAVILLALMALGRAFWLEARPPPRGGFHVEGIHLTDGDSLRLGGESYRLTGRDGPFNAPETRAGSRGRDGVPVTEREAEWGAKALLHGRRLLTRGSVLLPTGERERYGRPLAVIRLPDGRDYGAEMIRAGLAVGSRRREHDHWNARRP